MAYDCKANQCDNMAGTKCDRVLRFSSNTVTWGGKALGNNRHNNARKITESLAMAAGWYPAMDCGRDSQCDDQDDSTLDTCDTEDRVCIFTPLRNLPAPVSEVVSGGTAFMESLVVSATTFFTQVPLTKTYTSAVPVCTVQYDTGKNMNPVVIRIDNIGPSSFDIKLQVPGGFQVDVRNVHCLVVEEGAWILSDGRKIEAQTYLSTVTSYRNYWAGERQTYMNSYDETPIVLGQVISTNDEKWSVFWSSGDGNKSSLPSATALKTGKNVGQDTDTYRSDEMIGFIVIESGHSEYEDTMVFEATHGPPSVRGYVQGSYNYDFSQSFSSPPEVIVATQVAIEKSDASWGVTKGLPSSSSFKVAVDEDTIADAERKHGAERLDFVALSAIGSISLFEAP